MQPEKSDQEMFDEQVNRTGRVVLQTLAGVGIVAALMLSTAALVRSGDKTTSTVVAPAAQTAKAPALPTSANVLIEHAMRGCHTMVVNGTLPASPTKTIHLAAGGKLNVTDNDVMPHQLMSASGPVAQFVGANMKHMGATSTVTFPKAGTYSLTTKAGEDYMQGVKTVGEDNTLRIKVVVGSAPTV